MTAVTLTGIDERTDLTRLPDSGGDYLLEYAILISRSKNGQEPRYPSYTTVQTMIKKLQDEHILAAHFCGAPAREILQGIVPQELHWLKGMVDRIQINANEKDTLAGWQKAADILNLVGITPIFQWRRDIWPAFMDGRADVLLDRSGGRGIAEQIWPVRGNYKGKIGYAGGLGPDNLPISDIAKAAGNSSKYWIDMESSLRTHDWFDIEKAAKVLMALDDVWEYNYN